MKFRFAPVKRPLLALVAVAAMIVGGGFSPATAADQDPEQTITHNNLSFPGTMGRIRVRPQFQDRTGLSKLQQGDTRDRATNPNRTVGDVPAVKPDLYPEPCVPATTDCLRTLANNDPAVNPTAGVDTKYHVGETGLILNEVAGFRRGDTILIGSPYCNHSLLKLTCKRFLPGFGIIDEQPVGEIAHVIDGDIGPNENGIGVLRLKDGLVKEHPEGSVVVKLPTLYQGQQFRVDINHSDLLDCDYVLLVCHGGDVEVKAWFLPPQGSHDPSFPARPLALHRDSPNGPFSAVVAGACGIAGCGAGFFSFYIPSDITGTATIGRTFDVNSPDTWYTVIVEATDTVTRERVADGLVRFKLNPASIINLKAENPTNPGSSEFFPMESVEITGEVRDNSSAPALSGLNARPVEDVIVDVEVTQPSGSSSFYQTTSCIDRDPSAADSCGGNIFGSQPNGHGNFQVTYGGPMGIFVDFPFIVDTTCNDALFGLVPCAPGVLSMLDTFDTGTYDVRASLRGYIPAVTASTTFDVILI